MTHPHHQITLRIKNLRLQNPLKLHLVSVMEYWEMLILQALRSEEHTSELQSRETISYAVFCLKKKKKKLTSQAQDR